MLSIVEIQQALEDAGFDIFDVTTDSEQPQPTPKSRTAVNDNVGYLDRLISRFASDDDSAKSKHVARHLENCEVCRRDEQYLKESKAAKTTTTEVDQEEPLETMQETPLVVVDDKPGSETVWRASIAIGGMTCAVCSGAITTELQKKPYVRNVVVNLISNSGTVDYIGDHDKDIVEAIEDIGYEATIDNIVDINTLKDAPRATRTVDVSVDGMFCGNCPGKVSLALEHFGDKIKIEKGPELQDPILRITYTPQAPDFTIRTIIETISEANPAFDPKIYHPPTLEERSRRIHRREQLRILIRAAVTLVIAVPTLVIGIVYMSLVPSSNQGREYLDQPLAAGVSRSQWALFIMATPVYFFCADVFHRRALKEVRSMWRPGSKTPFLRRFYRFGSMNMLMSLGTSIAYISSVAQLIAAGAHPSLMPDDNSFYFDSVVFLTLFLLCGRLIEAYSKSKTGDAVMMLGKLRPTEALLVVSTTSDTESSDGKISQEKSERRTQESIESINVDLLEFGDIVKVRHGGSPPCDGVVIQGETKFDESSLTGEARLIKKTVGDEVFSGTVNKDAPISIRITGVAGSSMLDQIVKAVREGQTRRAPIERIADTLTGYFVPMVTLIAIVTWIIWLSLGISGVLPKDYLESGSRGWVAWSLQFAIAVFVVACPCGLALAAPTALFVGGGLAAQNGILVKGGGDAFEKASRLDCIVFDKTGTLTIGGEPVVTDFEVSENNEKFGAETTLGFVKAIEENSSHTVAKALVSFCKSQSFATAEALEIEEIAGMGMKGVFSGAEFIIGNETLMTDQAVSIPASAQTKFKAWQAQGKSVALAAIRQATSDLQTFRLAALFAISDPIRPEAPRIIRALQSRGTDIWMLSGDNLTTASAIGAQVGIPASNIIAGVLPSQKAEKIQYLQKSLKARGLSGEDHVSKRAMVAMVGDGINDSPALTTADIGIAIGSGSDIAISSAEFVLVSSNLHTLHTLLDLSKVVFRRIKFNFAWALVYNLVALPVAAGALYPIRSGGNHVRLDPVWASLAMAASSISVVCSSLALRSSIKGLGFRARPVEE